MKKPGPNILYTPTYILAAVTVLGIAATIWIVWLALNQPWLGLTLEADYQTDTIQVTRVSPHGPSQFITALGTLTSIGNGGGRVIDLSASDKIEEPDTFETYQGLSDFLAKQGALHDIISGTDVHLLMEGSAGQQTTVIVAPTTRPLADLPMVFWAQILVAVAGSFIGSGVFFLRRNLPAACFALAGIGIAISAASAALYSTRELALPGDVFRILSGLNHCGATLFGSAMIALFLKYPRSLVANKYLLVIVLVTVPWQLLDLLRLAPGEALAFHLLTAVQMLFILICVCIQYFATHGDPRDRAVLYWLGLSVAIGAGAFVLLRIVPTLFGMEPSLPQGYAFLFFLLIYVGLAFGVTRFRLFDIGEWAFRIVFYLGGVVLLVVLDASFVILVSLEKLSAFSLSFLSVAFLYLPFRELLARKFVRAQKSHPHELFGAVVDIAFLPDQLQRTQAWESLMTSLFNPLKCTRQKGISKKAQLLDEGLQLQLPAIRSIPALTLEYAHDGRKLFTPRDVSFANELIAMLNHAIENRYAHERGVAEERERIARDMHDNIGAQLLGALHSKHVDRKDTMIRETLTDLRDIINNASHTERSFDEILADLRVESAERLSGNGVELSWTTTAAEAPKLRPAPIHAIRSVIREAVSNVIKHADAEHMSIAIEYQHPTITLVLTDDGKGFSPFAANTGNGLANMKARLAGMNGTINISQLQPGTQITAKLKTDGQGDGI